MVGGGVGLCLPRGGVQELPTAEIAESADGGEEKKGGNGGEEKECGDGSKKSEEADDKEPAVAENGLAS